MPKRMPPRLAHSGEPTANVPATEIPMMELTPGVDAGRGMGRRATGPARDAPADDPLILSARRIEKVEISRGWDRG